MMPIKFRAWDIERREYLSGGEIFIDRAGRIYLDGSDDKPDKYKLRFILEQFTGLLDKNGKEGYDGELIRASVGTITGVVKWNKSHGAWWVYIKNSEFCPLADSLRVGGYFVGNIHENPELLE